MISGNIDWRIGSMGFAYTQWRDVFYPRSVKQADWLKYYAMHFDCVELDTTFHAMPTAERVKRWASQVPVDFEFTVKTPKQITHEGKISDHVAAMQLFVETMRHLEQKLGVILLQFSPYFQSVYFEALKHLLDTLPPDIRFAAEFRHESWNTPQVQQMLAERKIARVSIDYFDQEQDFDPTANFEYIRWLGIHDRFPACNKEEVDMMPRLQWWKERVLSRKIFPTKLYGTFNNDYSGYSVLSIEQFRKLVNLPVKPHKPGLEETLFG